jgi:hypothetical protein
MFLAQFIFGSVFSIVPALIYPSVASSASATCGTSLATGASWYYRKDFIQLYIDEDVGPFKPCESILKEAVVGDLIEFDRRSSSFNHWAIFIRNGRVADPSVLEHIETCDIFKKTRAMVFSKSLTEVAGSDYCRVNNKVRSAENRGLKPRSEEEIMESVQKSMNKGFDYNILYYNCEHKVTEWKFGLPFSDQVTV